MDAHAVGRGVVTEKCGYQCAHTKPRADPADDLGIAFHCIKAHAIVKFPIGTQDVNGCLLGGNRGFPILAAEVAVLTPRAENRPHDTENYDLVASIDKPKAQAAKLE